MWTAAQQSICGTLNSLVVHSALCGTVPFDHLVMQAYRWSLPRSVVHTSTKVWWYTPQLKCGTSVVQIHTLNLSSAFPASSSLFVSCLGALMWHCMPCVAGGSNTHITPLGNHLRNAFTSDRISVFILLLPWKHSRLATLCLSIPLICDSIHLTSIGQWRVGFIGEDISESLDREPLVQWWLKSIKKLFPYSSSNTSQGLFAVWPNQMYACHCQR